MFYEVDGVLLSIFFFRNLVKNFVSGSIRKRSTRTPSNINLIKGLVKIMEVETKARTEVASATGEFAQALYGLAASDLGESPSHSLNGLAGVESKAQEPLRVQTE